MQKIDINLKTNSYNLSHFKSNVFEFDSISIDYGREAIVYLNQNDRIAGKFVSVQHIRHMSIFDSFVGTKLGEDFYVTSIEDILGVLSVVCEPHKKYEKIKR